MRITNCANGRISQRCAGENAMILNTSDNVELFYETFGSGDNLPVLLLHGLGADHQMWQPQISAYPSQGFFVIAPDMRGHGASSTPGYFSLADCARDARELLDELGVERACVVGVSMGGLIAQQFACDCVDRVDRLVIVDSFSGATGVVERFNARLASFLLAVLPVSLQTKLLLSTYERMGKPQVAAYFETCLARADVLQLQRMRRVVNQFNIFERLHKIGVPTLVLVGDGFGKTAIQMATKTAEAIPGAQFGVLEGGRDPSNLLVPEVFDREVLGFIWFGRDS